MLRWLNRTFPVSVKLLLFVVYSNFELEVDNKHNRFNGFSYFHVKQVMLAVIVIC